MPPPRVVQPPTLMSMGSQDQIRGQNVLLGPGRLSRFGQELNKHDKRQRAGPEKARRVVVALRSE